MYKKIEVPNKLKIKKDDSVLVISGNSKGKQGKVLEIKTATNRALVEGVNMATIHAKPSASNPNGGIIKREGSIHISNLKLIDPKTGKPTRVGRKMGENGKLVRYAKISGGEIK